MSNIMAYDESVSSPDFRGNRPKFTYIDLIMRKSATAAQIISISSAKYDDLMTRGVLLSF